MHRSVIASPQPPRYGSIAAAADTLNVTDRTVRRYIAEGLLTGYRLGPRLVRVDLNEVAALLTPIPCAS